jgi:ubiquitin C-terminal hydrolase
VLDASTHCKKCGHVSTNEGEVEGTISVPIQPRIQNGDLSAYLKKYFNDHVFGFKCNKCKDDSKKYRPRHIAHSPDLILIQLKRFNGQGRKDSYPVPFSTTLDLNSYRTPSNRTNSEYELSAVVSHSGTTSSGHYRCAAKGADKCWNIFDDSNVTIAKTAQVTDPGNGKGWTPYLLFYQRVLRKRK